MGHANFGDIFIAISKRHPGRPAVESPGTRLTWREFVARASQVARDLASRGVPAGARVGIANRRNEDTLVQMCAAWMLGAVAVPMDFRTKGAERAALASEFELHTILEDRAAAGAGGYRSVVTDAAWLDAVSQQPAAPHYSPEQQAPALVLLTSGSSGKRMGALLTHEQLFIRTSLPAGLGQRDAGGRLLNLGPLSFSGAIHNTLAHLRNAGTIIFFPVIFSPQEVADAITTMKVSSLVTVPTVVRGLLDIYRGRDTPAFDLTYLYCAGAPMDAAEKQLAMRVLAANFIELYASALTGRISFLDSADALTHPGSVGRVLPQVNLQVLGADGRELPLGEPGVIRVRSPGMTLALCGDGIDRQRGDRIAQGWVYTGDVGRVDEEGFLYLLGRDSEMIIRGGENVYPAEVEAVALALAGVKQAVVVGFAAGNVGEEIAIFIVADPALTEQAVGAHLRARLVPNKTPRVIRLLDKLPLNENGKVSYAQLREELASP